jgi:hypothetical protein
VTIAGRGHRARSADRRGFLDLAETWAAAPERVILVPGRKP